MLVTDGEHRATGMTTCRRARGPDEFLDVVRMAGSDHDQLDGSGIGGEIAQERDVRTATERTSSPG